QGLEYVDGACVCDGVGQPGAVADHLPVDEDRHVTAQRRLVIEHIAARLRVVREHLLQHITHGRPGGFRRRATDMTLDIGREDDLGHQLRSVWRLPFSLAEPRTNRRTRRRQGRVTFLAGWNLGAGLAGLTAYQFWFLDAWFPNDGSRSPG